MPLSDIAEKVIGLSEDIQEYWDSELPKRHPGYPIIETEEDSDPAPPQEAELQRLLEKLPDDAIYKLLLVMYLGRGDYGTRDLDRQLSALKRTFGKPEWAIAQMMGKAPLAEYLSDGLARLREDHIDIDDLPRPMSGSRK